MGSKVIAYSLLALALFQACSCCALRCDKEPDCGELVTATKFLCEPLELPEGNELYLMDNIKINGDSITGNIRLKLSDDKPVDNSKMLNETVTIQVCKPDEETIKLDKYLAVRVSVHADKIVASKCNIYPGKNKDNKGGSVTTVIGGMSARKLSRKEYCSQVVKRAD